MADVVPLISRKTTDDHVFDHLFQQISSLILLPGTRISEAEIARQLNVSRQPVRDAFNKLDGIDLLLIRPQRPTEVRRFSLKAIVSARFLRETVEAEVLRRAAVERNQQDLDDLTKNLEQQHDAILEGSHSKFHDLDALFHKKLCDAGKVPFASRIILEARSQIDRLCILSVSNVDHMNELLDDHTQIVELLKTRDTNELLKVCSKHLGRLSETLKKVQDNHPDYFES